jgi:signal transduction histidine kinase
MQDLQAAEIVYANENEIREALTNLIMNAVDALDTAFTLCPSKDASDHAQ